MWISFNSGQPQFLTLGAHTQKGLLNLGLSVCVSVKSHLTYGASVCPESAVMYLVGNEGQKICGNLPETTALNSYAVKQANMLIFLTHLRSAFSA